MKPFTATLLLFPWMLSAQAPQQAPPMPPHIVRATGEATVSAKPDQTKISIGVTTQASKADDAVKQDADKVNAVVTALKSLISGNGEIQTSSYTVGPTYRYEPNQSPTITGFEANHTVEVTLHDLSLTGKVIDVASKAGANVINRIDFTLKDDHEVREQAIAKAAAQARANAESIAKSLGLSVIGVYSAETTEAGPVRPMIAPLAGRVQGMMAKAPTEIQPGTIDAHASVMVSLEVR